jgi:hypothetical protein
MKKILAVMLIALSLPICQSAKEGKSTIILPNPKLLACKLSDCSQLWSDQADSVNAVFPKQLIIDSNQRCVYGIRAMYDKDVSIDDLKAAVDKRYGKWLLPGFEKSSLKLWRVEPEKLAIQLSVVVGKKDKKITGEEPRTKDVIFLAFGGQPGCTAP